MIEVTQPVNSVVAIQAGGSEQLLVLGHKSGFLSGVAIDTLGDYRLLDSTLVAGRTG